METSGISVKPTQYSKSSQAVDISKQASQTNRANTVAAEQKPQTAIGDTVKLSSESLKLAKSSNTSSSTQVPSIEDRNQAKQAAQDIVERMRQQKAVALDSQSAISGGKLKTLLA